MDVLINFHVPCVSCVGVCVRGLIQRVFICNRFLLLFLSSLLSIHYTIGCCFVFFLFLDLLICIWCVYRYVVVIVVVVGGGGAVLSWHCSLGKFFFSSLSSSIAVCVVVFYYDNKVLKNTNKRVVVVYCSALIKHVCVCVCVCRFKHYCRYNNFFVMATTTKFLVVVRFFLFSFDNRRFMAHQKKIWMKLIFLFVFGILKK